MSALVTILVGLFSFLAALLPTAVYALLVWWSDRYEKEPPKLLIAAFIWGSIPAVIASALVELAFHRPVAAISGEYGPIVGASLVAPPVEETIKGLAVLAVFWLARHEFDDVLDGVIYGAIVGLGFAMTENIVYFLRAWHQGGLMGWGYIVPIRTIVFGLNHAMFTSLTGIGFGLARFQKSALYRVFLALSGLAAAMTAHFIHNFFASLGPTCILSFLADWMGVATIIVIIALSLRRERAWITTELADEVDLGILTPLQYEVLASRRGRLRQGWQLLGLSGISHMRLWYKLVDAAIELAFKKHQRKNMGEERGTNEIITALRAEIVRLRERLGEEGLEKASVCSHCGQLSTDPATEICARCNMTKTNDKTA